MDGHSENITNWLRLIRADSVGPAIFSRLLEYFGSIDNVLDGNINQLSEVEGIGRKKAEKIYSSFNRFDAESEVRLAESHDVTIINIEDERYPAILKKIYYPPPVLYIKGEIRKPDSLAISIVGSRRCSMYGRHQASRFAHLLASAGFTIISGMARGIDTAAHSAAITAGGRTIAVQGCGLGNIFPPENKKLFHQISKNGCCISELPINYEPLAQNFPSRNRIIAGLSLATLVVEATARSGALITARFALENNREVMAVPGQVDSPLSCGPHDLIKHGAALVGSVDDIMRALGVIGESLRPHAEDVVKKAEKVIKTPITVLQNLNLSENQRRIYDSLSYEPVHIEDIITQTDIPVGSTNASLISLQLKGLIKQLAGNYFIKK